MKIIIIGKRDQMGTIPVIRVKGMSRLAYVFNWDPVSRHYVYEPKSQREADDIFRTQGRLYKRMFFSALMDEVKPEPKPEPKPVAVESFDVDYHFDKAEAKPKAKKTRKAKQKLDHDPELQTLVSEKGTK